MTRPLVEWSDHARDAARLEERAAIEALPMYAPRNQRVRHQTSCRDAAIDHRRHGRLLHRGSKPLERGIARPALIANYSGTHHRPAMPTAQQHESGGWFFTIRTDQQV